MSEGTVKWFNASKGYGCLACEGSPDVFVHYSAIESDGFRTLQEGQMVEFELEQGPKGLQAAHVIFDLPGDSTTPPPPPRRK
mgnify:FL=1